MIASKNLCRHTVFFSKCYLFVNLLEDEYVLIGAALGGCQFLWNRVLNIWGLLFFDMSNRGL